MTRAASSFSPCANITPSVLRTQADGILQVHSTQDRSVHQRGAWPSASRHAPLQGCHGRNLHAAYFALSLTAALPATRHTGSFSAQSRVPRGAWPLSLFLPRQGVPVPLSMRAHAYSLPSPHAVETIQCSGAGVSVAHLPSFLMPNCVIWRFRAAVTFLFGASFKVLVGSFVNRGAKRIKTKYRGS